LVGANRSTPFCFLALVVNFFFAQFVRIEITNSLSPCCHASPLAKHAAHLERTSQFQFRDSYIHLIPSSSPILSSPIFTNHSIISIKSNRFPIIIILPISPKSERQSEWCAVYQWDIRGRPVSKRVGSVFPRVTATGMPSASPPHHRPMPFTIAVWLSRRVCVLVN